MKTKKFVKKFQNAWDGIVVVAREEQSFRIQLMAASAVLIAAFLLNVSAVEGAVLLLVIVTVLVLELVNSVLERLVDVVKPRLHPVVAEVKNIAAGAVFLASIGAVLIALLIFIPYIF